MSLLAKIFGFKNETPIIPLPPLKKGDFVRTDWFLVEQTAKVLDVHESDQRVLIWIMPLMINKKRYDSKLTGIDFYYLQEQTKWVDMKRILRMANQSEIIPIKSEYGVA